MQAIPGPVVVLIHTRPVPYFAERSGYDQMLTSQLQVLYVDMQV